MTEVLVDEALIDRVHRTWLATLRALARAAAAVHPGTASRDVGTGFALFAGEGSPLTQAVGFAHRTPGDPREVTAFFAARCATWEVAITPYTDPETARAMLATDYQLGQFEGELACWTDAPSAATPRTLAPRTLAPHTPATHTPATHASAAPRTPTATLRIDEVDGDEPAWLETTARAWAGEEASPASEPLVHIFGGSSARKYLGFVDGVPAGTAVMWDHPEGVVLAAAATRTAYRGHGLQAALVERRVRDAGPDRLALVSAAPGSISYRNAQRAGFHPLWSTLGIVPR